MRPARVALALALAAGLLPLAALVRSALAPGCDLAACPDIRFRSAASGLFAAIVSAMVLSGAPAAGRKAWTLTPLLLIGLGPLARDLLFFQNALPRCGVLHDLTQDAWCAHPDWWMAPGLFSLMLAGAVLLRSASAPAEDGFASLTRVVLAASAATLLLMGGIVALISQFDKLSGPGAGSLAGVGALLLVLAGGWKLFTRWDRHGRQGP